VSSEPLPESFEMRFSTVAHDGLVLSDPCLIGLLLLQLEADVEGLITPSHHVQLQKNAFQMILEGVRMTLMTVEAQMANK